MKHPTETLAQLYQPADMPEELKRAHAALDREVDTLFGLSDHEPSLLRRQEALFARYQELAFAEDPQ